MIISLTEKQLDKLVKDIIQACQEDCQGDADDCHNGLCPYLVKTSDDTYCNAPEVTTQIYDLITKAGKIWPNPATKTEC